MNVAFVFNAQDHQVLHTLPAACELSRLFPEIAVTVLVRSPEQASLCEQLARFYPGHRLRVETLRSPCPIKALASAFWSMKALVLWANVARLDRFDALVVPERTSLLLKKMGVRRPLFVHMAHGVGGADRPCDRRLRQFDLLLMPNARRMNDIAAAGNARPGCGAVVGAVKLDLIGRMSAERPRLFANDRPTILYNPHQRGRTTSWHSMGHAVLDHFAASSDYNLVFAPHVRLFDPPHRHAARFRRYEGLEHVRIDIGSTACIDMTYTLAADVYLGDLSSQVLEFAARPRPCIFLNPGRIAWRDDPGFVNWRLGPVVDTIDDMAATLATRDSWQPDYVDVQRRAVAAAFPALEEPAPILAAKRIAALLHGRD